MYYGDSENPYHNTNLKYYFQEHLPMDEFAKGNFSQAHKIIETYREYIKSCLKSATHHQTGGEGTIHIYLQKRLAKLEQEHKERTEKKTQAIKDMEDIQKQINDEKKTLKDEGKNNKFWNTYFNYLEKYADWDTYKLKRAFEETMSNKPETFIAEVTPIFERFIVSALIHINQLEELGKKYYKAEEERNKANHTLSHKSNWENLEKQIHDIKTGEESAWIQNQIRDDILKLFKKMDHMSYIADKRSLQEMFTSIMATELITNCNTEKKVKNDLIRNHTDKIGLFDHIRKIYKNNNQMFLEIETGRYDNKKERRDGLMKDKIESIAKTSREILEKISAISFYFRVDKNSPEEVQKRESLPIQDRKQHVIDDLVAQLEKALNNQEKKGDWRRQPDAKITKLFEGIYSITESHEFKNYCERLRNLDAEEYRDIIGIEGRMLLRQIYTAMDQEERNIIASDYNARGIFEQVEKDVLDKEMYEQEKQLSLYNFPPIYNLDGYREKAVENIKSQIKDISYHQTRKLEGALREMLQNQGYKQHIDSGEPMPSLSDEEFITIIKTYKGGKSLSSIFKKANVKLLPDIHDRIEEMKKKDKKGNITSPTT